MVSAWADNPGCRGCAADRALADDNTEITLGWAAWFDLAECRVTAGVCELLAAEHNPARTENAITLIERGTADRVGSRAFDQIALWRGCARLSAVTAVRGRLRVRRRVRASGRSTRVEVVVEPIRVSARADQPEVATAAALHPPYNG